MGVKMLASFWLVSWCKRNAKEKTRRTVWRVMMVYDDVMGRKRRRKN